MSRFSKAEAEARGWVFVHQKDASEEVIADGVVRHSPPSLRAEKYVTTGLGASKLINEEADSEGLLLERIFAYEQFQGNVSGPKVEPVSLDPGEIPVDPQSGLPLRTVITPEGELTEAEFSSRDRTDAIYDGENMVFFGPHAVAVEADEASQEIARDAEDEAHAEEDFGPTEQIEYDTADSIDSPGQSAGGVLVVREGESLEDVSVRRDHEKADAESARVDAAREASIERKREEEALEVPSDEPSPAEIRSDAVEDKAQEFGAEADKPENVAAIREAGAEAVQSAADEKAEAQDDEPEATPAARELAEEEHVDLSNVEGSGKGGKVIKPDVERVLESDPED